MENSRFNFRGWYKEYKVYYYFDLFDIQKHTFDELDDDDIEGCTGLKDRNGKLIYEEDILKSIFSDEKLYEVIWCVDCYKLRVFTKSSRKTLEYLGLKNTKTSYEVIGNIHENKDLLEDK